MFKAVLIGLMAFDCLEYLWIFALLCVNSTFAWQVAFACTAQQNSQDYDLFCLCVCLMYFCLVHFAHVATDSIPSISTIIERHIERVFEEHVQRASMHFLSTIPNNIRYLMIPPTFSSLICIRSACTVRSSASCWNLWI